jgi:hypothetical protein
LLVLSFFIVPIVIAETTTYSVQKAICRKGFDAPVTPTDCTSELTTSDDTQFRLNTALTSPAYVNGTWNISLHSDFSIDKAQAVIEWQAGGDAGQTVLDWYYYNETNATYQIIGCSNSTSLVKEQDQIDICNITWIYSTTEDITNMKLEAKFERLAAKKDVLVDYLALNLTYHDVTPPKLFDIIPVSNLISNTSTNIEISANATDYQSDKVFAQIIYPNSTIYSIELNKYSSTDKYNNSFTIPTLFGRYNITFIANDSSNNINNTEKTYFILINTTTPPDTTPPQVWNVTPKVGSNFSLDSIVDITANVTDNVAVDTVFANVTNPDLSVILIELFDDDNDNIYNNSVVADQPGWYYITIIANDTSGNINNTETTNFDPASLGGGGGGGGGGASEAYDSIPHWRKVNNYAIIKPYSCIESWLCTEWTECPKKGNQTRECDDWNKCGTETTKPFTEKECEYLKEKKESKPRFATSLLLSRQQTFTAIGGLGIAAIIILLGVSIYLLYRKTDKKIKTKNKKRKKVKINMLHRLQNKYKNV